ncbi:MAG: beta-ketoacyl-[acyl-carrier-protein] synthase family protein [Verrucomicrobiota bacterium]
MNSRPRVVVTGMGCVSAYGIGTSAFIDGILAGKNTIQKISGFDPKSLPVQIASEVHLPHDVTFPNSLHGKPSQMAFLAAKEALTNAHFDPCKPSRLSMTASIGWTPPPIDFLKDIGWTQDSMQNWTDLPEFPESQAGFSEHVVAKEIGVNGSVFADHAACAASLHSIINAARLLVAGETDCCLAGGSDSRCHPLGILGYARIGALNKSYNEKPSQASMPFDRKRNGFVVGEGAGFLFLETLEHANQRGATPIAEITGWALSNDAYRLTDPSVDGEGALHCLKTCLDRAHVSSEGIDYINAHGTSTVANDQMESKVYTNLLERTQSASISSCKSAIGHLSMAASVVECIATLGGMQNNIAPPTRNLNEPDPEAERLDLIGPIARSMVIQTALKTAFGFGGQNAAVIFEKRIKS